MAVGPRQLMALISVALVDGTVSNFASAVVAVAAVTTNLGPSTTPLVFLAAAGPVIKDDIFVGETYDGRVAEAMAGWSESDYVPGPLSPEWSPTVGSSFNSTLSSRGLSITTERSFAVVPSGVTQPRQSQYIFDFGEFSRCFMAQLIFCHGPYLRLCCSQNMAGQTTLNVSRCPAGTVITLHHSEVLFANGSLRNM